MCVKPLLRALGTPVTHLSLRQVSPPYSQSYRTTTPAHESISHASATGSTHATNGVHRHVLMGLLRFHWPTLVEILRFSPMAR